MKRDITKRSWLFKTWYFHHLENIKILAKNMDLDLVNYVLDPCKPPQEVLQSNLWLWEHFEATEREKLITRGGYKDGKVVCFTMKKQLSLDIK
jgi:hypothetical protein